MGIEITLDSSVIVKWFKKGEEFEREALRLRDEIFKGIIGPIMSEWVFLEVVRALVKVGLQEAKINQAYSALRDMVELGFIKVISISNLLEVAKDLEIGLNLYASDAVNLSPALIGSTNMLSEDKHLHRKSVRDFLEKAGLKVLRLKDLYPTK